MKKIKIQITHWLTGSILFEYETENNTLVKTIREANLWGANLRGANLRGTDLGGANLRGANLREANLWGANLRGTDLREANLWGANLRGTDLREANLGGANLRGTDLREANLWGANLRGTDLGGAKGIIMYWHIHHEMLVENLTEPLKNRIEYIKKEKPKEEIKLRLKLLKKVKCPINKLPHTKKDWEKLHRVECGCGWSSKRQTIFTKANGFEK